MDERILLVDDEAGVLESVSLALGDMGWCVRTASGPDEALQRLSEDSFQIAFVDNFLGPVRGVDLMEQMAELRPELDFVIMTASPDAELAAESLKKGAADFIRKPFRIEELLVSIDHVNRKKDLKQQGKELTAGLEQKLNEKTEELKRAHLSMLVSFSLAVVKKTPGNCGHSMRVGDYSRLIAKRLGLKEEEAERIKAAALLHDIGKIGISDRILEKKEPLTAAERNIIRSHAQQGADILRPFKEFEALLPGVLHHHERYDGSGYPAGLAGDAIPLAARIIAVADTYDSISSDRPYRPAAGRDRAVAELAACSGTQFDPRVVAAFIEAMVEHISR